jgi:hypothetical protein
MTPCSFLDRAEISTGSIRLSGCVPGRSHLFQKSVVKLGEDDEKRKRNEAVSGRTQNPVQSRKTASDMFVFIWFSGRDLAAFHIGVILERVQKILRLALPKFQV